jgi:hypothetical protein
MANARSDQSLALRRSHGGRVRPTLCD